MGMEVKTSLPIILRDEKLVKIDSISERSNTTMRKKKVKVG